MKYRFLLTLFCCQLLFSCQKTTENLSYTDIPLAHLSDYKMEILPEMPSALDEVKLVIYEDCKYNKLNKVLRNGTVIEIEKQFNSMIMAPCLLTNDTILIGKIPAGTYTVHYQLVDLATTTKDKTPLALSFKLVVSK